MTDQNELFSVVGEVAELAKQSPTLRDVVAEVPEVGLVEDAPEPPVRKGNVLYHPPPDPADPNPDPYEDMPDEADPALALDEDPGDEIAGDAPDAPERPYIGHEELLYHADHEYYIRAERDGGFWDVVILDFENKDEQTRHIYHPAYQDWILGAAGALGYEVKRSEVKEFQQTEDFAKVLVAVVIEQIKARGWGFVTHGRTDLIIKA